MAQKKKIKNVQISKEELKPTTIGYLNNRSKGPFLLVIIFAALFATLYYMPEITEYVNKIFNPALYAEMQEAKSAINDDNTGMVEELSPSIKLNISGVIFSSFKLNGNELSFNVDSSAATGEFENYYFETYDRSQKLLERVLIVSTSISSVELTYSNVKFIAISHYDEGTYPNVNLNGSKLTCTQNEEGYEYEFVNGGLATVTYANEMKKTDDNEDEYYAKLTKYDALVTNSSETGVEHFLTNDDSYFKYTKKVDLQAVSDSGLEYGYSFNDKSNQIAFEMSTKGYKCN